MMQIHRVLLRYDAVSDSAAIDSDHASSEFSNYRRGVDEWLVRWKEFIKSLPDVESRTNLLSWGQFNYSHGVFLVSLLGPTPGGTSSSLCGILAQESSQLMRHQQLFGQPYYGTWERKPSLVYPVTWTTSHVVYKVGLHALTEEALTADDERTKIASLDSCGSSLMMLEADPDNLLTGMSLVYESMRSNT